MNRFWRFLTTPRHFAIPSAHAMHSFLHGSENWAHRSYLLLVFIESSKLYGYAAIAMLIFEIGSLFIKEGQS